MGLEHREPAEVAGTVAWNDAQPGVQQVVGLVDEGAVVQAQRLGGLRRLMLDSPKVVAVQDERQRAVAEDVAVDFDVGQRVAELPDHGRRRLVDQHVFRARLAWCDVVDERDALVEEVPAPRLDVASHAVRWDSLPLQAGDEFPGNLEQTSEGVGVGLARRLLHRQDLDRPAADHQVVAMTLHG